MDKNLPLIMGRRYIRSAVLLFLLSLCFPALSQSGRTGDLAISGTVTDEANGEALPGVNVVVKGTSTGTSTDADGNYKINVSSASAILIFSYVGYIKQEVTVGNTRRLDVKLKSDDNTLNEVVVTGFGDRTKRTLGYSTVTVQGDELRRASVINPINALQGMVPGLQVQPGVGGPTATPRFLIRGSASLDPYRNQPLIVVDDIVMDEDVVVHNRGGAQDFGNILKDISPDEIESINILKGGAVTALYGSRANNGVILIKTKSGAVSRGLGVSFSHSMIWDKAYRTADFQNRFGAGDYTGDWITNDAGELTFNPNTYGYNFGPEMTGQTVRDISGQLIQNNPRPNNILDVFRVGLNTNTNVSVSGGTDKGAFRMSYSRTNTTGVSPNNEFGRHSLNLRANQKLLGKVVVDANVTYVKSNSYNPPKQDGEGVLRNFAYGGTRNYDTKYWLSHYISEKGGSEKDRDLSGLSASAWYPLFEDKANKVDNNLRGSVDLKVPILPQLDFQGIVAVNYLGSNFESKRRGRDDGFANPYYETSVGNVSTARYRGLLNYMTKANAFDFVIQGGGELNTSSSKTARAWTEGGAILPDVYRLTNSKNPVRVQDIGPNRKQSASLFFQGSATYRDYLTLNVYGRNDWNSTLVYNDGHGNYSYFYPGADVAWVFTDMVKGRLGSFLDYGKLRFSYAAVGNGTDPYRANTGAYRSNAPYPNYEGVFIPNYEYQANTLPNQQLKPERTNKLEAGLEFTLLRNLIQGDFTYYLQDTRDQIIEFGVPASSGVTRALINGGKVRNQGIELRLTATPVQTTNFSWRTIVNYTRNRNSVLSLPFGLEYIRLSGGDGFEAIAKAGGEYGTIIAPYAYARYQATAADGTPVDSPLNGKKVLRAPSSSSTVFVRAANYVQGKDKAPVLGSIVPKFLGSWRNTFTYKDFQLDVMLDSKFGGKIFSTTTDLGQWLGNTTSTLAGRTPELGGITYENANGQERSDGIISDGVYQQGTSVTGIDGKTYDISGMTHQEAYEKGIMRPTRAFAYYVNGHSWANGIREDAIFTSSWVSLQQVSLGYSLPQKVAKKLYLNSLRAAVIGNNLLYLYNSAKDNVNPVNLNDSGSGAMIESSGMPYIRSVGFMINGGF